MAKVSFNYKALSDGKLRTQAQEHARQIHSMLTKSGQTLVDIGKRLTAMREAMGSRVFREWVTFEFEWQLPTASNYCRVALIFGDRQDLHLFQPSAIVALSRQNVPASLVDEALNRAKAGETVTFLWVRQRLAALAIPPSRGDAGKPRSQVAVKAGQAPTLQSVRFILDEWKETLPRAIRELSAAEVADLESRIVELIAQIRSAKAPAPAQVGARRPRRAAAAVA